jgi:predicted signal transduction protein with EAL and GGDEF domain
VAGRIGGDEFTILFPETTACEAEEIAARILRSVGQPFHLDGIEIYGTVSIGISWYPRDGDNANDLQVSADSALYAAKEQGRNQAQTFSMDSRSVLKDNREMEQLVRQALEHHYLELEYQPKHDSSGRLAGFEALLRIRHPQRGTIMPELFIGVAERSGLSRTLEMWVLNEACRQLACWRGEGLSNIRLAVNISARDIRANLPSEIARILQRWGVLPQQIELELTETAAMAAGAVALGILQQVRTTGISVALDDFGTGYSSLSCLQMLPLDALKIDKSFVKNLQTQKHASALIHAILATAKVLELSVIAEGVEDRAQFDWLRGAGCDLFQGFYFAPALSSAAAGDYARQHLRGQLEREVPVGIAHCD